MPLNKESLLSKVEEVFNAEKWIDPEWPPYKNCSEEEKEQFIFWINMIAKFRPESLGAIAVSFEKAPAENIFLMYESENGDDKDFYSNRLLPELRGEEEAVSV